MARILKREPLLDGRHADNLGYVNSVDEAYKLITEFETGLTAKFSCFKADKGSGNTGMYIYIHIYVYTYTNIYMAWMIPQLWNHSVNLMLTPSSVRSYKILWEDARDI